MYRPFRRFPAWHAAQTGVLVAFLATLGPLGTVRLQAQDAGSVAGRLPSVDDGETAYIPMDSWVYTAADRLAAMGYLDAAFAGERPWTRAALAHALNQSRASIARDGKPEAEQIYMSLHDELTASDATVAGKPTLESGYVRLRGVAGTPLNDSFHVGQTFANDYGRGYGSGVASVTGGSGRLQYGRFALYLRGEIQTRPSLPGYSAAVQNQLATLDEVPLAVYPVQSTMPQAQGFAAKAALLEGYASYRVLRHELSFGRQDRWLGPARGGAMLWSNNAPNIWAFTIDRSEGLHVPLLSAVLGDFRYTFVVGPLRGHQLQMDPWIHTEKISFKPTGNLEFGFARSTIWGGKGHVPITFGSFFHSFFSFQNVDFTEKESRNDPGARFGTFDMSYRLPFARKWATLYLDTLVHDDVSPVAAPRHANLRTGIYVSHLPGAPRWDARFEGFTSNPPTGRSALGKGSLWEYQQPQGYTNDGWLLGDAGGREQTGGQVWLGFHPDARQTVEASFRQLKAANDFITGGTTQSDAQLNAVLRVRRSVEVSGQVQVERWVAPLLGNGVRWNAGVTGQVRWYR